MTPSCERHAAGCKIESSWGLCNTPLCPRHATLLVTRVFFWSRKGTFEYGVKYGRRTGNLLAIFVLRVAGSQEISYSNRRQWNSMIHQDSLICQCRGAIYRESSQQRQLAHALPLLKAGHSTVLQQSRLVRYGIHTALRGQSLIKGDLSGIMARNISFAWILSRQQ